MKTKIYVCFLLMTALSVPGMAQDKREKVERSVGKHTLNLSYSPVLMSSPYEYWDKIPPLKFALNYSYDIPIRSRIVNFYAIGEISYFCGQTKRRDTRLFNLTVKDMTDGYNSAMFSVGMGLKVHIVSCLDFVVFCTGDYRYTVQRGREPQNMYAYKFWYLDNLLGTFGTGFIGKIKNINLFLSYSYLRAAYDNFFPKSEHYLDIGVGYTF